MLNTFCNASTVRLVNSCLSSLDSTSSSSCGPQAIDNLQYIWVLALYEEPDDMDSGDNEDSPDEDDIKIPAWLVPSIKERIIKNDLSFMLGRPSDDSNNATLASIKPHGPQDDEQ